jgi:hypothetical protein
MNNCGRRRFHELPEVEEAKALMIEAMEWSVFTWLFQKNRVRETADRANTALDKLNSTVKSRWNSQMKAAYRELTAKGGSHRLAEPGPESIDHEIRVFVKKVKEADDAARHARTDAEDTFDEAESQLNTDLAREGCKKAIHQWKLDEKAIRRAETIPPSVDKTLKSKSSSRH